MKSDTLQIQKREYLTQQARNVLKRTTQDILDLSQICHEFHKDFGYQDYIEWVKNDLGISERMGRGLLNVYEQFGVTANFAANEIGVSALYLLAAPSTPESARDEAIKKAELGETITHAEAQELIKAHKEIEAREKKIREYEQEIKKLKEQLPTSEILQRISKLQAELIEEKNKPAKVPDDYEDLKKERERLNAEKKRLVEKHKRELENKDEWLKREIERKVKDKDGQIAALDKRIENLKEKERILDKSVGNFEAYKTASKKIRDKLYDISITLQDVFSDYEMPDECSKDFVALAMEMKKGADDFMNYLQGVGKNKELEGK